ncbi:MAG: sulfatase [Pedobacter sp.]|nr:sulfatase [Pedobacter sp.]MDQ8053330.1 sulfatase [Pedobacter sp.]
MKFCYIFLLSLWASSSFGQSNTSKPNIIFVLTDDHRWDALGVAGNKIIQTPNLDQLANKGLYFKNAYVTTAICCVSRASLLTGQYESRHQINDFKTDLSPTALQQTYPLLLKHAGYQIGFVGKYGVGLNHPVQEFDYWSCSKKEQPPYIYLDKQGKKVHNTDSVGHDIELFLNKFAKHGPFCLSVGFKAPHELDGKPPTYPTQERFDNLYKAVTIPEPETAQPKYWLSFPDFFRTDQNIARERWKPLFSTPELYQQTTKSYYRLVTGVDEVIGKMMVQLKKLGIEKNTVIIFMGDNGFYLGEHGLQGKWYGHEESIRVPLIVYDPRLPAAKNGKQLTTMALNIDIAPTILSLAGVATPTAMQGQNLFDLINGKLARKDFFYEHTYSKSPKIPNVEGIVTKDFKYMKYIEHNYEELYNIANDPKEKNNLAGNQKYAAKLNELRKEYLAQKKAVK